MRHLMKQHCVPTFISGEEIANRPARVGKRCAAEESSKEATDDQGTDVRRQGDRYVKDDEKAPRDNIYWISTIVL